MKWLLFRLRWLWYVSIRGDHVCIRYGVPGQNRYKYVFAKRTSIKWDQLGGIGPKDDQP